jgi:tRNA pseudouridine55 synthase
LAADTINGWLILDKPLGLSSAQGVAAVKRILRGVGIRPDRIGHGGTLDPLATGVLPIAIGEATKLAGRMLDASKGYDFTVKWGEATSTEDAEGAVIARSEGRPDAVAILAVLPRFTGPIDQVPPTYSALKVDGQRAYNLARSGEGFELPTRYVNIFNLGVTSAEAEPTLGSVTLTAHVSKGTYIRSLARDIALALGTVGHVTMLRRLCAGPFDLNQAISLDLLDEAAKGATLGAHLRPIEAGLDGIPALFLTPEQAAALRQGRVLAGVAASDGLHFAKQGDTPVALVEIVAGLVRVERGFNL